MMRLPSSEPSSLARVTSSGWRKYSRRPYCTPRPVASTRPLMPPRCTGLPVTQPMPFAWPGNRDWYVSEIQPISRSPVPMSGAGTLRLGWMRSRLANSCANRRVIFSRSFFTVLPWVDLERALGAAEGDHHDGALVRHQRRQRLNLVLVGEIGVADAALDRQDVFAVDGAPAGEHLIAFSQLDAELHLIDRVAASDLFGEAKRQIHGGGGAVEHPVDAFAEGDFVGVVHHGVAGLAVATEAKRFETPL